jgi:DNA-directed RNA polymerase specialized sigma24 family protein
MATMDWAELYRRFARDRNDAAALDALERRVRPWARADLWQRGWHLVEDAILNTCGNTLIRFATARGPETFGGFVRHQYLAARKAILKVLLEPVVLMGDSVVPDDPPGGPPLEVRELLRRCLDRLPTRDRLAIELRYFQDAATPLMAAALETTEGNARQVLFTALRRLRECVRVAWASE